jgi:hypothetical protein
MLRGEYRQLLDKQFEQREDLAGRVAYARLRPLSMMFPETRKRPSSWNISESDGIVTLSGNANNETYGTTVRLDLRAGEAHRIDRYAGTARDLIPVGPLIAWWQDAGKIKLMSDMPVSAERRIHGTSGLLKGDMQGLTLGLDTTRSYIAVGEPQHMLSVHGVSDAALLEASGITHPVRVRSARLLFETSQRHGDQPQTHVRVVRTPHGMRLYGNIPSRDSMMWFGDIWGLSATQDSTLKQWYCQFRNNVWREMVAPPVQLPSRLGKISL